MKDESFEKYHKIKMLGNEDNDGILVNPEDDIIIEEKMDGGNFRFMYGKNGLLLGSRTRELDEDNPNSNNFKRCIEFIKDKFKDVKDPDKYGSLIFYGECMVAHTMAYDWENIPPYLGFDIKDIKHERYLEYDSKKEIFEHFGLPMVPLIKRCKAKDIKTITDKDVPASKYYSKSAKNTQAEGIVLKNYKKNLFAKYVREEFKEECKEAFGDSKKWAKQKGDDEVVVAVYCTNPRIEKIIFKLVDDNFKLDLTMMSELPRRVITDIYEEHWKEICHSNWSLNFKDIRKKINKRCLAVLKQVIVNNAFHNDFQNK